MITNYNFVLKFQMVKLSLDCDGEVGINTHYT